MFQKICVDVSKGISFNLFVTSENLLSMKFFKSKGSFLEISGQDCLLIIKLPLSFQILIELDSWIQMIFYLEHLTVSAPLLAILR